MVDVPGVGRVIDIYTGTPVELRWLSIHTDGRIVERRSDNLIGWSVWFHMSVQFCLVRDVSRLVDPVHGVFGPFAVLVHTDEHGTVVVPRDGGAHQLPHNPVASAMLAAVGAAWDVHGPAAWIGARHPETGLHADLGRLAELRALAAHCRSG